MSVYAAFPLPVVAYSILHRARPGISRSEYEGTIRDMHRAVEEESARFSEQHAKLLAGLAGRQAQNLRGSLSQFLETPIRSDNAEVQRIFSEAFDEFRSQVSEEGPCGATSSSAGFALASAPGPAWLKRLETNAKRSRQALGLEGPKGGTESYESVYVMRGGLNLDVLEHIVRDRLGILAGSPFVAGVSNLVHASRGDSWKPLPSAWGEAVLSFDKGAMEYDQFRASAVALIDRAISGAAELSATLWQRKLGLGRGSEFSLRVILPGPAALVPILDRLCRDDSPFARETFGTGAGLTVKEIFYPRGQ